MTKAISAARVRAASGHQPNAFTSAATTSAVGYLADNWSGFNRDTPALIVNPQASPHDLLAWCWGEVRSLQSSAQALGTAGELIEPADFAAMFQHRLDPLADVMTLAMDALQAAHRAPLEGASGA